MGQGKPRYTPAEQVNRLQLPATAAQVRAVLDALAEPGDEVDVVGEVLVLVRRRPTLLGTLPAEDRRALADAVEGTYAPAAETNGGPA